MGGKQGRAASQGEACLQVKKMMGFGVEMPESEFFEPQKIGSRPGFLKNVFQDERIQSKGGNLISSRESYGKFRVKLKKSATPNVINVFYCCILLNMLQNCTGDENGQSQ